MCSYLHMEKKKVEGGEAQDWRITADIRTGLQSSLFSVR